MPNEIYAELVITSRSLKPEEITDRVGLVPASIWKVGEQIGISSRIRQENGWVLASGLDHSRDLREHLHSLMEKIAPTTDRLSDLAGDCEIEVACVLYAYDFIPEMHFDAGIVRAVAAIGAEIDLDLYNLVEETEKGS
jgi:hypothetical protein